MTENCFFVFVTFRILAEKFQLEIPKSKVNIYSYYIFLQLPILIGKILF